jgi:aspartate/tyrosine/aromatic aminotransferase
MEVYNSDDLDSIFSFSLTENERLNVFFMVQYLPIEGLAAFNKATADLLLGADNPVIKQGRVWSIHPFFHRSCYIMAA